MEAIALQGVTVNLSHAGISAGTTTTLTTANAQVGSIKGKSFSAAAASNETTPTTDAATGVAFLPVPVSKGCVFAFCRDSAGAMKVVQGEIVDLDAANAFTRAPQFPSIPGTLCPVGYILVKVGSTGSAWTFGASNFAGPPTGVVFNLISTGLTLPDRPQIS